MMLSLSAFVLSGIILGNCVPSAKCLTFERLEIITTEMSKLIIVVTCVTQEEF